MSNNSYDQTRRFSDDGFGVAEPRRPSVRPMPGGYQPAAPQQRPQEPLDIDPDYEWDGRARQPAPQPAQVSTAAAEAAQGRPVEGGEDDDVIVLSRAYRNQGQDVRQVRFRKPRPGDLRRVGGYPLRQTFNPVTGVVDGIEPLPDRIMRFIHELSEPQLLPSTIDAMEFEDFEACSGRVVRFFMR